MESNPEDDMTAAVAATATPPAAAATVSRPAPLEKLLSEVRVVAMRAEICPCPFALLPAISPQYCRREMVTVFCAMLGFC